MQVTISQIIIYLSTRSIPMPGGIPAKQLRPCAVQPLSPEEIAFIRRAFRGLKHVVTVYEVTRPKVTPLNQEETLLRRPKL